MNATHRASISTCSSCQIPRSCGEIRPSLVTAFASVMTSAAPPTARLPKCTRCQSVANPSSLEYSHIGETTSRLRRVTSRIFRGENRLDWLTDMKLQETHSCRSKVSDLASQKP